jgi:hypothetical protein
MNNENSCYDKQPFNCPERLPASAPDDNFCSPFLCPEKIATPRFSSPNSPLPPEEFEKLMECIEAANELLRTIGNPNDPDNKRVLQLRLRELRGLLMQVTVACGNEQIQLVGTLKDAGRDFIQLETFGRFTFVLYERICSIRRVTGQTEEHGHQPELIDLDTCSRRAIVLDFGRVVSCDPNLINIFFGLPLHLRLISFLGCRVEAKTENSGEEELIEGKLSDSQEIYIHVQTDSQLEQINFNKLCFIDVLFGHPDE